METTPWDFRNLEKKKDLMAFNERKNKSLVKNDLD
jgi:hypothetical protein